MEVLFILNIKTNSDEEYNQTIQEYLMQNFQIESTTNNSCILKKKGYNKTILWILIIIGLITFFLRFLGLILWIIAVIYYVACKDEVVVVNKTTDSDDSSKSTSSSGSFCSNCGAPLDKDAQFCAKCGFKILK